LLSELEAITAAHAFLEIVGAFCEAIVHDRHHMLVVAAHELVSGAEK
jgi:hypothetical protein